MKIPTHPIASRLSVGFDKLLVSVKGTFHKENSTKDFGLTQRSNALLRGFTLLLTFNSTTTIDRSPKIKFFRGKLAI
ncbi:MAG: hypothetical protein EAZ25_02600 [Oscillatoriales cyanobacterium]|nr:MAG: hypothetical protein EAZ25_02600 [Oscillatoriales cyanobacterium]